MDYQKKYKNLYFELVLADKKITDLKRNDKVISYINDNSFKDNFIVDKYIKLVDYKNDLLVKLNDLYLEMELNNVYIYSPFVLMKSVYNRIKSIYPNIDNDTLNHYIMASLYNMRYKDNTFDRQQSRIKRLKLDGLYNNWYYKVERNK